MINIDQSQIHKNCTHYKDGFCTLNQISVDPEGTACPIFTPKHVTKTGKTDEVSPSSMQPNQQYPRQRGQSYSSSRPRAGFGMGGQGRMKHGRGGRGRNRMAADSFDLNILLPEPIAPEIAQEKQNLTNQLEDLEKKVKDIKQRLEKRD